MAFRYDYCFKKNQFHTIPCTVWYFLRFVYRMLNFLIAMDIQNIVINTRNVAECDIVVKLLAFSPVFIRVWQLARNLWQTNGFCCSRVLSNFSTSPFILPRFQFFKDLWNLITGNTYLYLFCEAVASNRFFLNISTIEFRQPMIFKYIEVFWLAAKPNLLFSSVLSHNFALIG